MNIERLIKLYRDMMAPAGWVADDEGFVSVNDAGVKMPCLIGKKEERVVLPIPFQMQKEDKSRVTFFHLLDEHISQPETEVFKSYRHAIAERFKLTFLVLATELLTISASEARRKKLTPKQSEVLTVLAHVDEKTIETFMKLMEAIDESPKERALLSIYLNRGGQLADKTHQRVSVVFFPLYEALVKDGAEREKKMAERKKLDKEHREDIPNATYDVKMRPKDRQIFIGLFEYLIPHIAEKDAYSASSNAAVGPSADALMASTKRLALAANATIELFSPLAHSLKDLVIEMDWVEAFEDIGQYASEVRKIPTQKGGRQHDDTAKKPMSYASERDQLPSLGQQAKAGDLYTKEQPVAEEPAGRTLSLSKLNMQAPLGYQPYQPYGNAPEYDRREQRESAPRQPGRTISPSDAVSGMLGGYYENNHRTPLTPQNRQPSRGGGRRGF